MQHLKKCNLERVFQRWIITAAHCEVTVGWQAIAGEHKRSLREGTEQTLNVVEGHTPEGWDQEKHKMDIALVKVDRDFIYE